MSKIVGNNGTISGNGVFTTFNYKIPPPTIVASYFDFVVPTTTTYQYGTTYTLSAPILSPAGQSQLGGTFSFAYSVSGSPSIDDISVNLNADGTCNMTIDKIGTSSSDTSATVFIYATLSGSSNYDLPITIPIIQIQSNGIQIVKKPIVQSNVASNFTFRISDVSYNGDLFTVSGPTCRLPGSDFTYSCSIGSGPIQAVYTSGNLFYIQQIPFPNYDPNPAVGPANVVAKINSSMRYDFNDFNNNRWLNSTFNIDKGNTSIIPFSSITWSITAQIYSYGKTVNIIKPYVYFPGANDMTFTYTTSSTAISISGSTMTLLSPSTGVDISAISVSSRNYDISNNPLVFRLSDLSNANGIRSSLDNRLIIIDTNTTIVATDFIFSVPTTTYQYGTTYTLSAPQLSASGQSRLGGTFSFSYSVSGSPSIDDISVNLNADGTCNMTIDKIGTSSSDTSATVFIYATLQGSSYYDLPSTKPIIQSNGIQIVKKPIVQNDVASNFTFKISDVSYNGDWFTVSGPNCRLPGSDFTYSCSIGSGPIQAVYTSDNLFYIQQIPYPNYTPSAVGLANVISTITSSMRYDFNDFNNNRWLNSTFNIDKGNTSIIPFSSITWSITAQIYSYGKTVNIIKPYVYFPGANDMKFTYTTSSTAINISGSTMTLILPSTGVDITATSVSSRNYDISNNPLVFRLSDLSNVDADNVRNSLDNRLIIYPIEPSVIEPSGYGFNISTDSSYTYHTFTEDGTITYPFNINGKLLIVGGGGGGGYSFDSNEGGGGGGAGSLITCNVVFIGNTEYNVKIGSGGNRGTKSNRINQNVGGQSKIETTSLGSITALGGGAGARLNLSGGRNISDNGNYDCSGMTGGSGGGATGFGILNPYSSVNGAGGLTSEGSVGLSNTYNIVYKVNIGANGYANNGSGGGGGAGSSGDIGTSTLGGNGGSGFLWSINNNTYGGGGGGSFKNNGGGSGGSGGGGNGGGSGVGGNGTSNTGSGGGGGGYNSNGGNGGSGIVIIAIPR